MTQRSQQCRLQGGLAVGGSSRKKEEVRGRSRQEESVRQKEDSKKRWESACGALTVRRVQEFLKGTP